MRHYTFVFSAKWLGYLLLAAMFAAVCVGLGFWQLGRRAEVLSSIDLVKNNYSSAPVPYSSAANWMQNFQTSKEWTPVQLHGQYLDNDTRIVRNRVNNGSPGYEVVVPFKTDSGDVVVVDRGWLPIGDKKEGYPDSVPPPPSGEVTVVGHARPSEPSLNRGAPAGEIATIDLPALSKKLGASLDTGAYLQMANESPAAAVTPTGFPQPSVDEGPHLSYAMQWYAFAALFFIAWGYMVAQQARFNKNEAELAKTDPQAAARAAILEQLGNSPAVAARLAKGHPRKPVRKGWAEAEEDAVLDAAGYHGGADPTVRS